MIINLTPHWPSHQQILLRDLSGTDYEAAPKLGWKQLEELPTAGHVPLGWVPWWGVPQGAAVVSSRA